MIDTSSLFLTVTVDFFARPPFSQIKNMDPPFFDCIGKADQKYFYYSVASVAFQEAKLTLHETVRLSCPIFFKLTSIQFMMMEEM